MNNITGFPQYSVKFYRDDLYKLIKFNKPLIPRLKDSPSSDVEDPQPSDDKLINNVIRARGVIQQVALCNDWPFFCTFTIDKEKYDRYDFSSFYKAFTQWIRDYRKKYKCRIEYCFIPETHKDGAWHLHGFIKGIPDSHISNFVRFKHPRKLVDGGYLNWAAASDKFGFCSLGVVRNSIGAAFYVSKYITKDLLRLNSSLGAHLYFCSLGLKRAFPLGYVYGQYTDLDKYLSSPGTFCSTGWVKPQDDTPLWASIGDFLPYSVLDLPAHGEDPAVDEGFVEFYGVQLDLFEGDLLCADCLPCVLPS